MIDIHADQPLNLYRFLDSWPMLSDPFERTPDGDRRAWLLFSPSVFDLDPAIHAWTRPCEVFTSQMAAVSHLAGLLGEPLASSLAWTQHDLFPDLFMATDSRGWRWLLCTAPVDAGVGR